MELGGHRTTGTYDAATPPHRRIPLGSKWVLSTRYKPDKDCLVVQANDKVVAMGFNQMRGRIWYATVEVHNDMSEALHLRSSSPIPNPDLKENESATRK